MLRTVSPLAGCLFVALLLGGCGGRSERSKVKESNGGDKSEGTTDATAGSASDAGNRTNSGGTSAGGSGYGGTAMGGGVTCDEGTLVEPFTPSTDCTVSPVSLDADILCGKASCPITNAYQVDCAGSVDGSTLVPRHNGASVIFRSTSVDNRTLMFTLEDDATTNVVELPIFVYALAVDESGAPAFFTDANQGIARLSATDAGYREQRIATLLDGFAMDMDARVSRDGETYVTYVSFTDNSPHLVSEQDGCFIDELLSDTEVDSVGLTVDDHGKPWVAWWRLTEAKMPELSLYTPDGSTSTAWTGTSAEVWMPDSPKLLSGGVTGQGDYPIVIGQTTEAIHAIIPDGATGDYSSYSLANTEQYGDESLCDTSVTSNVDACSGRTTCDEHREGTLNGFGVARTASGRAYVAWLTFVSDTTYNLSPRFCHDSLTPEPTAEPVVFQCECSQEVSAMSATASLMVAELGSLAEQSVHTFTFNLEAYDEKRPATGIALAARGESLLVMANVKADNQNRLLYFEIDTAELK
jgi:hypothetical protein